MCSDSYDEDNDEMYQINLADNTRLWYLHVFKNRLFHTWFDQSNGVLESLFTCVNSALEMFNSEHLIAYEHDGVEYNTTVSVAWKTILNFYTIDADTKKTIIGFIATEVMNEGS